MRRLLGIAVLVALVSAGSGGATSAAAPTAITGPVSALGPTSATVSGTVNPGGQATSWYVEYGPSTSYGKRTSSTSAGSGTANAAVSASLASLTPATTYHYRVVATNAAGTARGADGIFTTSAPPVAVTGAATGVSVTSATLNGTVDPNGRATTWYFEYGTSTSYGSKTAARSADAGTSPAAVSAAVSGLRAGRRYHFRLVASSDAGTSRGKDQRFSTSGAPTVVTGSASSIAPTSARLSGTVTPNGRSTSWWFEYGTTTRYGARTSVRNAGSGTGAVRVSASLTRLKTATVYHFRLVARNASGTSAGADGAFSTSLPPLVRTGPAQDVSITTATMTGSVDPRGRATRWYFEFGTSTSYGGRTTSRNAGSGVGARTMTAALNTLTPGTTYHYRLVALSDAGTTRGADVTFTTLGVTLAMPALRVVYGRGVLLSGAVPTRRAGEAVTVLAQRLGEASFTPIAEVVTAADGSWRYLAKPAIRTSYAARWNNGVSPAATVGVRPMVSIRRLADGRVKTRVAASRSFAGRFVQLQRRTAAGRWVTLERLRLGARSGATFRAALLPRGRSVIRVAMSVNQAGEGYLAGFSRRFVYRR